MDLFNQIDNGAIFSNDKKYRYVLWRIWNNDLPKLMFIGLNPSTANQHKNDNTINRIKGLCVSLGFGGFYMLNLFTYITAYPRELNECLDPVGPSDKYISMYIEKVNKTVLCYGSFKQAKNRAIEVKHLLNDVYCLGINRDGSPLHPLYCPTNSQLILYK